MTIEQLKTLRESEDHVEFKAARHNFSYNGGSHNDQNERRKCFLGYIVAFANEGGGTLVLGMADAFPHEVVGSDFSDGKLGALTDDIYIKLGIRVEMYELFENSLRVLVTEIPSRPIGKMLKYEGVPLMRVGESLRNMSDEEMFAILSEQEPDFSAKVCEGLMISDLDPLAIRKMKESYAAKQNNFMFTELSDEQVLSDLKLLQQGRLNYAALILLGKRDVIARLLPQCRIIWEYRNDSSQIYFDAREIIEDPLYIAIENIWRLINQPTLNRKHPDQSGTYIFDIYDFNEVVLREAILNAVAHRDYTITSEVVIKQYPDQIIINNPGGFPKGVTIENLLTVSSTPRSRLMTEVMEKTGLVERSGQGVDKIFSITLSEGKHEPDYSSSDMFQVTLTLRAPIIDRAFYNFIKEYRDSGKEPKLGVEQIITLGKIRNGLKGDIIAQLEQMGLINRASAHTNRFLLSEEYLKMHDDSLRIGKRYIVKEVETLLFALQGNTLKIGDLEEKLAASLNRNQIKYLVGKLNTDGVINKTGAASGTRYELGERYADIRGTLLLNQVVADLRKEGGAFEDEDMIEDGA
jgi:ATP-dependent DNA helicase RecG